jgi:hypothetical protein
MNAHPTGARGTEGSRPTPGADLQFADQVPYQQGQRMSHVQSIAPALGAGSGAIRIAGNPGEAIHLCTRILFRLAGEGSAF